MSDNTKDQEITQFNTLISENSFVEAKSFIKQIDNLEMITSYNFGYQFQDRICEIEVATMAKSHLNDSEKRREDDFKIQH